MTGPWDRERVDPDKLAREMVGKVGRPEALRYMIARTARSKSVREAGQGFRLIWAVLRV